MYEKKSKIIIDKQKTGEYNELHVHASSRITRRSMYSVHMHKTFMSLKFLHKIRLLQILTNISRIISNHVLVVVVSLSCGTTKKILK